MELKCGHLVMVSPYIGQGWPFGLHTSPKSRTKNSPSTQVKLAQDGKISLGFVYKKIEQWIHSTTSWKIRSFWWYENTLISCTISQGKKTTIIVTKSTEVYFCREHFNFLQKPQANKTFEPFQSTLNQKAVSVGICILLLCQKLGEKEKPELTKSPCVFCVTGIIFAWL